MEQAVEQMLAEASRKWPENEFTLAWESTEHTQVIWDEGPRLVEVAQALDLEQPVLGSNSLRGQLGERTIALARRYQSRKIVSAWLEHRDLEEVVLALEGEWVPEEQTEVAAALLLDQIGLSPQEMRSLVSTVKLLQSVDTTYPRLLATVWEAARGCVA